ncbi:hypothetical protein A2W14_04730 [Candidatus Gottesmanbacteria bacterium RBG_16_37_8]|uniref:DUF4870 domain-containing protein n=1 Tax=Candidatus Gottesmanbacteria bacterium RBG_16_37_8 TaxID=1798371 RepID=A0A1F5YUD8_9BACT|nr:MAG: hypothetical protein A2W14_04730 [Candidatus Gottesmanbacteria bacterium RBG_16_37_8]
MAEQGMSNEKLMGAAAYLLGPITGIVLLLMEKKNGYVRFHAMQSTIVFGAIILFNIALGIVPILGWLVALILSPIIMIGSFVLWLFLMWKAYSGEKFKLPYFGNLAEKQLEKMK